MKLVVVGLVLVGCGSKSAAPTKVAEPPPASCRGQLVGSAAATASPAGEMDLQLAPGFLDRMPACTAEASTIPAAQVTAEAGKVNAKGDCAWPSGVSCHFHLGVEFVASGVTPRPKLDELHCVFPTSDAPKEPHVYGTHFTCKPGTTAPVADPAHAIHEGASCGGGLLAALAAMTPACDERCCEHGTLTNPTEDRRAAGTLDVRPDFRICAATEEIDCSTLVAMTGHPANAPVYGAPVEE